MRVTKTGMILGTPAYAPPEQLRGEPLDARSDIYSVGATLYFLLTGVLPFPGANAMVVLASVLQGTPTPPENHQPAIPKALSVIVLRAMARQPSERFADYAEFRAALDALSGVEVVPGRPLERVLAFPIDSALASLIGMNGTEFVSGTPWTEHHLGWRLLITWGLFLCVRAVPEAVWGTSPGKRLFGLRMQRLDGAPMSWLTSVGRSSLTFLSGGVIGALLEIVPAFAGISSRAGSAYRAPQATRLACRERHTPSSPSARARDILRDCQRELRPALQSGKSPLVECRGPQRRRCIAGSITTFMHDESPAPRRTPLSDVAILTRAAP